MSVEEYSDAELEAECRLLGTMLRDIDGSPRSREPLPAIAFCESFRAAAYYAVLALRACGKDATPSAVWRVVQVHENADCFGFDQLHELSEQAADVATFHEDMATLLMRASRLCAEAALRLTPNGMVH